ncbi:TPA: trypsin-like peptidase domain-containing protein [Klebsiella quasipneumoniae]|nr:trypsin-like peptidase domain-containing protein [Klebsiella quasipneumoniae]HCM2947534.1 trypsin-like peptidase domain-containing protein [Klebsiella quasipneumoniae subsp. similipneumoniae]HCM3157905.1 trypsin-like peptidase domain-containing protein [Klebsiella quasipneumoniae subsp. similipneumoniae]HCM6337306.1 trypsin-like peptidase domain-containing protein [Klebsiella quasipneumoniae subsp. similipneumoniae]HCM7882337.1 trypsin-like peptidase domain-containing protein [Klebsiella qua
MTEQWKRAVVHLECATDSEHIYDNIKRTAELREKFKKGEVAYEEYVEQLIPKTRDIRFHGTAIFIIHKSKRYLLTARHVLFDERSAEREHQEEVKRYESAPQHMREHFIESSYKRSLNKIFNIIFRVPSLDEVMAGKGFEGRHFLMNLGAGASMTLPYTFSSPDLDLALISLDQRDKDFADELIARGYTPVPSELIINGPSSEGAEVFSVGFPGATSLIAQVNQHPESTHWSSSYVSLPVFSWGKVSMLHPKLPFYWCDMSIYPGNSGGPLVEDGKLVGIVSAQATLPLEGAPQVRTRIPFGRIIKTEFVKKLFEEQEAKDQLT